MFLQSGSIKFTRKSIHFQLETVSHFYQNNNIERVYHHKQLTKIFQCNYILKPYLTCIDK